jgi:hypothetical protein
MTTADDLFKQWCGPHLQRYVPSQPRAAALGDAVPAFLHGLLQSCPSPDCHKLIYGGSIEMKKERPVK